MSIQSRLGAAALVITSAFGAASLTGCADMQRGQTTTFGALGGALLGGAITRGPIGALAGAVAGGAAGHMLGSDCTVNTYGSRTRQTYGNAVTPYVGSQTETLHCKSGVDLNPNNAPPPGTVPSAAPRIIVR